MDDIRPPRNTTGPTPTSYGRVPGTTGQPGARPATESSQAIYSTNTPQVDTVHSSDDTYSLPVARKSSKKMKIFLVLSIILAVGFGAVAAWQYTQIKDLQSQVDELTNENQRLNERVYSLNYDNRDLNQKVELLTTENESLKELNKTLLEECGSACTTVIP